ncbi:MAG: hypothetical protein ACI9OE_002058 [Mariniflexile sp.]|jgi:hypothetical protein
MVWKAKTKMEQKVEFIHEWLTGAKNGHSIPPTAD